MFRLKLGISIPSTWMLTGLINTFTTKHDEAQNQHKKQSRKHKKNGIGNSDYPFSNAVYLYHVNKSQHATYIMSTNGYLVTFSNHLTMPNITLIEIKQTKKNTPQHCQIGHLLYINGPTHKNKLPTAVAPSHKP